MKRVSRIPALFVIGAASLSPVAAHAQAGDAQAGERQFVLCAACHTRTAAEPPKSAPSLIGVFGRKAGTSDPKFAYSDALKASGLTWNNQTLDQWLSSPTTLVPGSKMAFAGVASAQTRANIIAYLKQFGAGG